MSGERISGILFDLDDTLLDRAATLARFLPGHLERIGGGTLAGDAYCRRFHELDHHGYADRTALFNQLATEFPQAGEGDALLADYRRYAFHYCQLATGAREALHALRAAGYRLAIVTNGPGDVQRRKLQSTQLLELVDAVLISGEERVAKPDPEIFRRAADRLGVAPEACLFVGDHPDVDIRGALAAGMHVAWLRRHLPWPGDAALDVPVIEECGDVLTLLAHPTRASSESA